MIASQLALAALLALGASASCSDDDSAGSGANGAAAATTATGGAGIGGDGAGSAGGGQTGGETATGGSAATGGQASTGGGGSGPAGLDDVGTLVVLGDSIGDGGGVGPYYYELLRQSLVDRYGPLDYHNNAQGGSETDALVGQVNGLPEVLAGPVVVTITSGGNDMKAHLTEIVAGIDAAARTTMGTNIAAALDLLLAPGRFGAGVEVHVFEANIYDSSDGQGNFAAFDCNFSFPVALPTDGYFASWNGEIAGRVAQSAQVVADIHGLFYDHGFNNPPNWYASDCTHPNATGHDELRRLFYRLITSEELA